MTGRVIVVGSVNVDLVVSVDRLPGAGETLTGGSFSRHMGGKGANQAVAAARLGAATWLVGCVGEDAFADDAREALSAAGVAVEHLATAAAPTGVALVVVDAAGENQIVVAPGANATVDAGQVITALEALLDARAIVLANLEVPDVAVLAAARAAQAAGARFVLDPAPARPLAPELVGLCFAITPNEHELPLLGAGVRQLLAMGAAAVVVTRGPAGADLWTGEPEPHHQAAFPVSPVDTTGAGDAFSGAFAWALADGRELPDALRLACAAGALSTVSLGAQSGLPDRATLERILEH